MAKNISTVIISASLQKVWNAITMPEAVKKWQFGSDLITDWKVGRDIRFNTLWEGVLYQQWGKVLEVKEFELIKYSLFAPRPDLEDKPENYFIMNYKLTKMENSVLLEIIQEDNRPNAKQENPQGEENPILNALKLYAEK